MEEPDTIQELRDRLQSVDLWGAFQAHGVIQAAVFSALLSNARYRTMVSESSEQTHIGFVPSFVSCSTS